ncbi:MAG: hypothetical protein OEY86_07550 [Nitrospira sp.]|nr:hypothetical protein [Nitrospira sp.]
MKITLVLDVPKLRTKRAASDFSTALAEHIVETFNDDTSIKSLKTSFVSPEKGNT